MACRWKWAETGRQQRPRREGPGGSRRGHCPGPRSPSYRPGGQHPTSEQEKSHTHRTSHHSRAPLSTGAAGPTATPKPGDGGSESGAQTCPPGATATAAGKWLAPERGRVGEKVLRATVRGSGSQGLSPQEPLLGEDLRGPLGSWQGEGTSLLRLAPDLPPPPPPVPRCLWAAGAPSARGSPTPPRAPRGGSQAGGPSLGPVPWASPRGCCSASGHGGPLLRFRGPRAGAGSICRSARVTGHEGRAGKVTLLPLHLPVPRELTRYPQGDRSRCAPASALSHCGHACRSSRRPISGMWGPRQVLRLTPPPRPRSQVQCDAVHLRSSILDPGG